MEKQLAIVVEDDPMLGEIYSKTLEADYEVELITNGIEALRRLKDCDKLRAPRLVVLDINLPGMSGMKLFEEIRADPVLTDVHVIICSANSQAADLLGDSADLALIKPVSPMQLRALAGKFLKI